MHDEKNNVIFVTNPNYWRDKNAGYIRNDALAGQWPCDCLNCGTKNAFWLSDKEGNPFCSSCKCKNSGCYKPKNPKEGDFCSDECRKKFKTKVQKGLRETIEQVRKMLIKIPDPKKDLKLF